MKPNKIVLFLKQKKTLEEKIKLLKLVLLAMPIAIYLIMLIATLITPPRFCDPSLTKPEKGSQEESFCNNRLTRPIMYLRGAFFTNVDNLMDN